MQRCKYGVVFIYKTIAIPTVLRLIIFSEDEKAVASDTGRRRWLRREIAEQLTTVIDRAITVPVKHKKGLIRSRRGPRDPLAYSIVIQIKIDAKGCIDKIKTVSRYVNDDRTATAATGACIANTLAGIFIPAKYLLHNTVFVLTKVLTSLTAASTSDHQRTISAVAMNIWSWTKSRSTTILRQNDGRSRHLLPFRNPTTYISKLWGKEIRKASRA
jgi:hypothetical protein